MDSTEAKLLSEQLGRMVDSINSRLAAVEKELQHHTELDGEKLRGIRSDVDRLAKLADDHEARLRAATDGVTSFRVWSGLAAGGSSIISIVAFIKTILGN